MSAVGTAAVLQVLTFSSLLGKGSVGEFMEKEFPSFCAGCAVQFKAVGDDMGLIGRLRTDRRRGRSSPYAAVLGIEDRHYRAARQEKLLEEGQVFEKSPLAFIVDTQRLPRAQWPKDWAGVAEKLKGQVLVQEPGSSDLGIGWLRAIFEMKALSVPAARGLLFGVFPSWSASYRAFLEGKGKAVWSFRTSEAYHRCQGDKERYAALPLAEGYPLYLDWVAPLTGRTDGPVKKFLEFARSKKVQAAVPRLNWMLPADDAVTLPDCYANVTPLKVWDGKVTVDGATLRRWVDEWNL